MGGGVSVQRESWEQFKSTHPLEAQSSSSNSVAIEVALQSLKSLSASDTRLAVEKFLGSLDEAAVMNSAPAADGSLVGASMDGLIGKSFDREVGSAVGSGVGRGANTASTEVVEAQSESTFRVALFSSREYDEASMEAALERRAQHLGKSVESLPYTFDFFDTALNAKTAALAADYDGTCTFVNDNLGSDTLKWLHKHSKVKLLLLRCAGYNNVDLPLAGSIGFTVANVPSYSPYSVAEHAVALCMAINRKVHVAHKRTREFNFSLSGLVGFDMHGKTVGIVGTGKIGSCAARIFLGFGCRVLAYNRTECSRLKALGVEFMSLEEMLPHCDVISLHAPLLPSTKHLMNENTLGLCKQGVILINTSRGGKMPSSKRKRHNPFI